MKGMWVGYDVGCTMGLTLGHGAWQIDRPSYGSMWNCYSFQPVGQWMGYSFTDPEAEGCCRSLNALLRSFMKEIIILQGVMVGLINSFTMKTKSTKLWFWPQFFKVRDLVIVRLSMYTNVKDKQYTRLKLCCDQLWWLQFWFCQENVQYFWCWNQNILGKPPE